MLYYIIEINFNSYQSTQYVEMEKLVTFELSTCLKWNKLIYATAGVAPQKSSIHCPTPGPLASLQLFRSGVVRRIGCLPTLCGQAESLRARSQCDLQNRTGFQREEGPGFNGFGVKKRPNLLVHDQGLLPSPLPIDQPRT